LAGRCRGMARPLVRSTRLGRIPVRSGMDPVLIQPSLQLAQAFPRTRHGSSSRRRQLEP
jgi:hypothetical protein